MPREYGAPTGVQKPQNTGRQGAQPGNAKDYLQHMIDAHNTYHNANPGARPKGDTPKPKSRASFGADVLGIRGNKVPRRTEEEIEKQSR